MNHVISQKFKYMAKFILEPLQLLTHFKPMFPKISLLVSNVFIKNNYVVPMMKLTLIKLQLQMMIIVQKKSFPLRISSVDVTKSSVSCVFVHIYWRNP